MSYFQDFPNTFYKFGDETKPVITQDLSTYVDVLDTIKDEASVYTKYQIFDNERPDQLSFKLYGTPAFYWTFFLMNDNIREQGWPLSNTEIVNFAQRELNLNTITTRTTLSNKFRTGNTLRGVVSGATGLIDHRHLDLGQLVMSNVTGTFTVGEALQEFDPSDNLLNDIPAAVYSYAAEYLSAHHYEDANGLHADIDPTVGPGALLTEVTYLDRYIKMNDALKEIRVIKKDMVFKVVEAFNEAVRS